MTRNSASQTRRVGVAFGVPTLTGLIAVGCYFAWRPRLPARLGTDFDADFRPRDFTATGEFVHGMPAWGCWLGIVCLLAALLTRKAPLAQRLIAAGGAAFAAMFATISVLVMHAHLDVEDPTELVLPGWHLGAVGLALTAGGTLGWFLAGWVPGNVVTPPEGTYPHAELRAGESVRWHRTVRSRWPILLTIPVLVLGVVLSAITTWWLLVFFVPVVLLISAFGVMTVSVSDGGLTVRLLGTFSQRVSITEIAAVRTCRVDPLRDFGGWGWRSNGKLSGFVLTSGPAMCVYRTAGSPVVVTLSDAEEAAALLNALCDRPRDSLA